MAATCQDTLIYQDTLLVCTLCGSTSQMREQGCKGGGELLLEQLLDEQQHRAIAVSIQAVRCMAVCKHSCAIAFMGQGKRTYVFGDLPVEPEALPLTAATVLEYAHQYQNNVEGAVPYGDRPALLRSRTLVVLPALPA